MNISILPRLFAVLLGICALLINLPVYADGEMPLDEIRAGCTRVKEKVESEMAPLLDAKRPDCEAEQMYYDLKDNLKATQADWNKVRACADARHDGDVLLMMYTNGFGVRRDRDAALFYACDEFGPKFSLKEYLQPVFHKLMKGWDDGKELDTCDYAYNRLDMSDCLVRRQGDVERKYNNELNRIAQHMTPAQKNAFAKLRDEVEGYASTYGEEVGYAPLADRGYPIRPMSPRDQELYPMVATEDARQQFLDDLKQAESGEFPDYSGDDFIRLDRSLNAAYRDAMHKAPVDKNTDDMDARESKSTLRALEQRWLRYRDAWVAFALLRYPKVPGYVWKAWLTKRRRDLLASP